jgi:hypothetical protein
MDGHLAVARAILDDHGPTTLCRVAAEFGWQRALRTYHGLTGANRRGENVLDREWDLLVVLDACRPDLLPPVADDYGFLLRDPDTIRSVGSSSEEWLDNTFGGRDARDVAYVTSNPFVESHLDDDELAAVDHVWRTGWDDELGTVPPRAVTDAAVRRARADDPARLLVHYMQPHYPFRSAPDLGRMDRDGFGTPSLDSDVWTRLQVGAVSRERLWEAFVDNLRWVLDDVAILLENVDADRVAITADHGNAFGEWRVYGHPSGVAIDPLRRVPWIETTAMDDGEHDPPDVGRTSVDEGDVADRLRNLGYV